MTPMIDVVFLLLIYFVWIASFHLPEFALPTSVTATEGSSEVPTSEPPPEMDFEEIVVRLRSDGQQTLWSVNDIPTTSLREVRDQLQLLASITPAVPVIVHPDPEVTAGDAIDVYDAALLAGFINVALATPLSDEGVVP